MEQIYKFLVNKVESKDPEEVRFGKYCYLCGNKIFTSLNQIPEHLLIQFESPLQEIECEEHLVDGGVMDIFQIIHDKNGIHVEHLIGNPEEIESEVPAKRNGRPKIKLPEDTIKELVEQGLGSKAIATRLKGEGYKTSYKTVQRILAGVK